MQNPNLGSHGQFATENVSDILCAKVNGNVSTIKSNVLLVHPRSLCTVELCKRTILVGVAFTKTSLFRL